MKFVGLCVALACTITAPAQQNVAPLKAYESCSFPDGLQVVEDTPMPTSVLQRPTQSHGQTGFIPLVAGRRVVFGYPDGVAYANVKVELLPKENYAANRKLLLDDFDDIVASDPNVVRNTKRKATQSGQYITGLDRKSLDGSTLGIYLTIDDQTHIAATVYLLNADLAKRPFKTLDQYASMRDTFLYNYTRCIRNNITGQTFGAATK